VDFHLTSTTNPDDCLARPAPLKSTLQQYLGSPQFYPQLCHQRSPPPSALGGRGRPLPALGSHTRPPGLRDTTGRRQAPTNGVKEPASPSASCNPSALSRCCSRICIYFWPKKQYSIIIVKWPDSHGGGWRPLLMSSPCLASLSSS